VHVLAPARVLPDDQLALRGLQQVRDHLRAL